MSFQARVCRFHVRAVLSGSGSDCREIRDGQKRVLRPAPFFRSACHSVWVMTRPSGHPCTVPGLEDFGHAAFAGQTSPVTPAHLDAVVPSRKCLTLLFFHVSGEIPEGAVSGTVDNLPNLGTSEVFLLWKLNDFMGSAPGHRIALAQSLSDDAEGSFYRPRHSRGLGFQCLYDGSSCSRNDGGNCCRA